MPEFKISHLDRSQMEKAFPLIWISAPGIDRQQWIEHCEHVVRLDGGVLGVTADDGAILGIAAYRPDRELRRGRILRIDALVAFELGSADLVRQALWDAIELLCHALGAGGMSLTISGRGFDDGGSGKARKLSRLGLKLDSVSFAKDLNPAAMKAQARRPVLVGGNPG